LNPVLASRIDRGLSSKTAARSAQVALSSDGRFLHLQDGPIDLIVSADGHGDCVRAALSATDVAKALNAGVQCASTIRDVGLIEAAFLRLQGRARIVAATMTSTQA
jgi:hypothetical protein